MNAPAKDALLTSVGELLELFTDMRFGQLIANLVTAAGGMDAGAIWDMEDDALLKSARRLIERNEARRHSKLLEPHPSES